AAPRPAGIGAGRVGRARDAISGRKSRPDHYCLRISELRELCRRVGGDAPGAPSGGGTGDSGIHAAAQQELRRALYLVTTQRAATDRRGDFGSAGSLPIFTGIGTEVSGRTGIST